MVALMLTLVQSNIAILIGSVLSGSAFAAGAPADSNARLKTAALTAPDNNLFIFWPPCCSGIWPRRCPVFTLDSGSSSLLGDADAMGNDVSFPRNSNIKHDVGALRKAKYGQQMWI